MQRVLLENGIDVPIEQLKLLMFISLNEGTNQQTLCNELNKAKPGISRLVNGLVEKGLIKQKSDKNDRRNRKLYVTQKGLDMRNQFYPVGRQNLNLLEEKMGQKESEELKVHLRAIKQIIFDRLNAEE
jgi:DNA-binding MarR family transcriptional regulator